jgi:hypothetical protein
MHSLKILAAAIAATTVSFAMAQGTPPKPASDPAVGAGQTSTQNTPMGTTGTPGSTGTGAAAQGSTAGSTAASTGAMSPAPADSSTMAADTQTTSKKSAKKAKADRN